VRKILFICDPLHLFNVVTDTTYLLMLNAAQMGLSISYCLPEDVYAVKNIVYARVTHITTLATLDKHAKPGDIWHQEHGREEASLTEFAAVFVRNDPPFNMEYYYLTQILTIAEQSGVKVVNNSQSLRNCNEKLAILNFPHLIPKTIVTKNKAVIHDFLNHHPECVIKPLDLMAGRSVFKLSLSDPNCDTIIENITNYGSQTIMLQEFIPEVRFGDRRIFIIKGEVISYCLHRIPQANKIRGNIAAGGSGEVHPISPQEHAVALEVAHWLQERRVVFAGIDVIHNRLTEINITSPTGTRQILDATGINIPRMVLQNML
jgi:glutathione synthase